MKPEQSERFLIEAFFEKSLKKLKWDETLNEIDKLTGDASTRRYYRLFTQKNSYVVCLDNPWKNKNEEYPFLKTHKFFEDTKIRVPKILDSDINKGYLLEEDLGDETLLQTLGLISSIEHEKEIYKIVVDELIKLHKVNVDNNVKNFFPLAFDQNKYNDEIDFTLKYYFEKFLKISRSKDWDNVRDGFGLISQELAKYKMCITHRDFHSRNIMVKKADYVIIDFQDARLGIPQYDLVSLLEDCYYQLNTENLNWLKNYYYEQMQPGDQPLDVFNRNYDLMLLQRVFKAVGSFSYIYNWRKDERYIKYIGYAMEKIKVTLLKYDEFSELRKSLFKIYYAS